MIEGENIIELIKTYRDRNLSDIIDHDKFLYYALTFHSTAIEGSTLTEMETRLLLDDRFTPGGKPLIHSQMVKDHYEALRFVLKQAQSDIKISAELIQQINSHVMKSTGSIYRTILGDVDATKGEYRKGNVSAGGHYFVGYNKVLQLTQELAERIILESGLANSIEAQLQLAFQVHYDLVTIHPFYDGNGRTSRLLMNFLLERFKLPLCILYQEDKAQYYEALEKGQQQGDLDSFFVFMSQQKKSTCRKKFKGRRRLILNHQNRGGAYEIWICPGEH